MGVIKPVEADVTYQFAPNLTHTLDSTSHFVRQSCHTWGALTLMGYLLPPVFLMKAICNGLRWLYQNPAPKPQSWCIGRPLCWLWQNPLKAALLTTISSFVNTFFHLLGCGGEYAYSIRSYTHTYLGKDTGDKLDSGFVQELVAKKIFKENNLGPSDSWTKFLGHWTYTPSHVYVHINQEWVQKTYERVTADPQFSGILKNKTYIKHNLGRLIDKHMIDLDQSRLVPRQEL